MPTIEDVARAAGVSRSTVSLVLNKSPLVRETTKRRVEEVIAELNYVPNNNARGAQFSDYQHTGCAVHAGLHAQHGAGDL